MKKISYICATLALIIMVSPSLASAMTLADVNKQLAYFTHGDPALPKVLGASATGDVSNIPTVDLKKDETAIIMKGLRYEAGTPEIIKKPLKSGSTGLEVSKLQIFLRATNHLKVDPTGKYLTKTVQAVKSFQKAQNLKADGVVGPMVRAKIAEVVKASTPEIQ